jgi:hypothetical protein
LSLCGTARQQLADRAFVRRGDAQQCRIAARSMCRYPGYPHYAGGDAKQASSYACRTAVP